MQSRLNKVSSKKWNPKTVVRKVYVERKEFLSEPKQELAFYTIKKTILYNDITGADLKLQYHSGADTSGLVMDGVFFLDIWHIS